MSSDTFYYDPDSHTTYNSLSTPEKCSCCNVLVSVMISYCDGEETYIRCEKCMNKRLIEGVQCHSFRKGPLYEPISELCEYCRKDFGSYSDSPDMKNYLDGYYAKMTVDEVRSWETYDIYICRACGLKYDMIPSV